MIQNDSDNEMTDVGEKSKAFRLRQQPPDKFKRMRTLKIKFGYGFY